MVGARRPVRRVGLALVLLRCLHLDAVTRETPSWAATWAIANTEAMRTTRRRRPSMVNGAFVWDTIAASWTRTRTSALHILPGVATPRQQPHTPQHLDTKNHLQGRPRAVAPVRGHVGPPSVEGGWCSTERCSRREELMDIATSASGENDEHDDESAEEIKNV